MDYEKLKEVIAKKIKENGREEITGPVLQMVLMAMVDSLGEVYPQTYTDEQKAQARANIDALSDYDGAITKEKLSAEVQAILNDVANKQNITDESLATIAKTIVGAINEVYNGELKDASIATSKIEDGAITEPKLDTALTAKVNNNVKTVEQALTDEEIAIASKNLKFRDSNGNVFLNSPFINFEGNNVRDNLICYSERNEFTEYGGNSSNTILFSINNSFGDDFQGNLCLFASNNNFGSDVVHDNVFGPCFDQNEIWGDLYNSVFGSGCVGNYIKGGYSYLKFDSGVSFIELANNSLNIAEHIHVLSGVKGKSSTERLVINIPDEYLNSSRELIITTKRTDGGPSTPEDIVMYYADEVVDKQNKQDNTLATTSKEVVGAINELFNGGVKDNSITTEKLKDQAVEYAKLSASIRSTLDMVGTNAKIINENTDLNTITEDGLYLLSAGHSYTNFPLSDGGSGVNVVLLNEPAFLIVSRWYSQTKASQLVLSVSNTMKFPLARGRAYYGSEWSSWNGDAMYNLWRDVEDSVKNQDLSALTDTEVNNIWDNN